MAAELAGRAETARGDGSGTAGFDEVQAVANASIRAAAATLLLNVFCGIDTSSEPIGTTGRFHAFLVCLSRGLGTLASLGRRWRLENRRSIARRNASVRGRFVW